MKSLIFFFLILINNRVFAQYPAYQIYNNKGKLAKKNEIEKKIADSELIFFGELHNNSLAHWLTWELLSKTFQIHPNLAVGLEMLETDQQLLVNDFLKNSTTKETFLKNKLWPNHDTDYQPILDFCKLKNIPVFASNIPRRYARYLYQNGMEALTQLGDTAKQYFPSIPFEVPYHIPSYMMLRGDDTSATKAFVQAQAVKDYTMAHQVCQYLPNKKVFHVNGSYHSDLKEGIAWYVRRKLPNVKILNFTVIEGNPEQKPIYSDLKKADFIIVVPENMHHSYE